MVELGNRPLQETIKIVKNLKIPVIGRISGEVVVRRAWAIVTAFRGSKP